MNRPRAADDFATIRARLDLLRRGSRRTLPRANCTGTHSPTAAETCAGQPQRSTPGQAGSANQHRGNDGCGGLLKRQPAVTSPFGLPGPRARNRHCGVFPAGTAS
jgi:hypothetical protein